MRTCNVRGDLLAVTDERGSVRRLIDERRVAAVIDRLAGFQVGSDWRGLGSSEQSHEDGEELRLHDLEKRGLDLQEVEFQGCLWEWERNVDRICYRRVVLLEVVLSLRIYT